MAEVAGPVACFPMWPGTNTVTVILCGGEAIRQLYNRPSAGSNISTPFADGTSSCRSRADVSTTPRLPRSLSCTTCQTKKPRNKSGLSSFIVDTKIESVGEPDIRHALHPCRHHRLFQVRRLCECHHPLETFGLKHNRYIVRVICPAVNT